MADRTLDARPAGTVPDTGATSAGSGAPPEDSGATSAGSGTTPVGGRRASRLAPAAVLAAVGAAYLVLGWQRRWVSDDGLIVSRTVRQVLAGHGPVFNVGERVEANTSPLWTYLLVALGWLLHTDVVRLSVLLGLGCAVLGLVLGMDAARRLPRASPAPRAVVPLGALVVLALPPFWDFATSGLETGLVFGWLGGGYRALLWAAAPSRRRAAVLGTAVLLGLGPLVRPELLVVAVIHLAALWQLRGRGARAGVRLLVAAAVLPVGYEVFRMGYYGVLVPQTAISKEAGASVWGRGLHYVADLVGPYLLWLPLLLVVAVVLVARRRDRLAAGSWPLALAPVAAGAVLTLYVVRLGGDFMHARMLLPPLFLLLLPVMVVPLRRPTAGLVAAVGVWTVVCATALRPAYIDAPSAMSSTGIADERSFWVGALGNPHPVTAAAYVESVPWQAEVVDAARSRGPDVLAWVQAGHILSVPTRPDLPWHLGVQVVSIGDGGARLGLDEAVVDRIGLAYPLAAHVEPGQHGRPGHEKHLPQAYVIADLGAPDAAPPVGGPSAADVALARRVLTCGPVAELQASVRAPLTVHRFWDNLTGAVGRTVLRIPLDPGQAVARFCR